MEIGDGSGQETDYSVSAGKVLTGESLYAFINQNNTKSKVSFASLSRENYSIDLTQFGGKFICQRFFPLPKVFLLESNSLKTRNWVIWWRRFHHAKNRSDGMAFVHTGGTLAKKAAEARS
jgi:hypothetical protein